MIQIQKIACLFLSTFLWTHVWGDPFQDTIQMIITDAPQKRVKVTGSHISGPKEGLQREFPLIVLNREDIEKTGYNSISDVLRDLTINSFGSLRETPGSQSSGFSSVNLRGLGATRTLVLVDGRRVQKDSLTNAVDLNLIPFAAVERIEILKDSASAMYGSDALGGVVNIITHQNFKGSEVAAKYFMSQESGGNQAEVSVISGYSHAKFQVTGVVYHRSNDMVYARDREYSRLGLSQDGASGTFRILKEDESLYLEPDGTVSPLSYYQMVPGCPKERIFDVKGGGQMCLYNYADHRALRPSLDQTSLMLNANFQVGKNVNTFARFTGTRRQSNWVLEPSPAGPLSGAGINILGEKAKTVAQADQKLSKAFEQLKNNDVVKVYYRLVELGNRISEVTSYQYNSLVGMTMGMGLSWEIELLGGYNESFREYLGTSGYARLDEFEDRLEAATFNPFASIGQRGELQSLTYKTYTTSKTKLSFVDVSATGQLAQTSVGFVGMAVGIQTYIEQFDVNADEAAKTGNIIGRAGREFSGDRNIFSSYMEFAIPLTSNIQWNLAGRQDSYSDFGQMFTPRTSIRWQATPHVIFYSSVGRGFKAPNIDDLHMPSFQGYHRFIDQVQCNANGDEDCFPKQWLVRSGGNPNLKEERSLAASLGTLIEPTENFSIGLETWYVHLENQVGVIDYEDITRIENQMGLDYVESFGIDIERNVVTGGILSITAPLQNLYETQLRGFDFSTRFSRQTNLGLWIFDLQHSHMLNYSSVRFPGLKKENKLGEHGYPRWRNWLSLTYALTSQSGSLSFRTVGEHKKQLKEAGTLERYTEVDLQYSYTGSWGGVISAGVRNVLGTIPPLDDSNPLTPTISHSLYDGNGRIGWIQYKQTF